MDVSRFDVEPGEVVIELLCHPFCHGCNQNPLVPGRAFPDLLHEIIHLVAAGPHFHRRIKEPCGPYHLVNEYPFALFHLIFGRCCAHVYRLTGQRLELLQPQRPVVQCSRQAEAIFHQGLLSRVITSVHRPYLGNGDMTFVDHRYEIPWKTIKKAEGSCSGSPAVKISGIILYAAAIAQFPDHLKVILHPLFNPFGLLRPTGVPEVPGLQYHVILNL